MASDEWVSVREDVALDYPEYKLSFEEYRNGANQMVFVHLYIFKDWSPKLLKRLLHEWGVILKHVTCPLFTAADVDDDKFRKFVTRFGFKFLLDAVRSDGLPRRIYFHEGLGNGLIN